MAQRDIYVKYAPLLLSVCRRYNVSGLEVQDLLQEAFIEIFKCLENYDFTKGDFRNWITTITIRTSIKAAKKFNHNIEVLHSDFDMADFGETPIDKLSAEELLQVIEKIPKEYRVVFNLFVIDGYTHKEIGDFFGIKESSSRSKLKRARDMISALIYPPVKKVRVL